MSDIEDTKAIIELDEFVSPEEIFNEAKGFHKHVTLITVSKNNGDFKNYVFTIEDDINFKEGSLDDLLEYLKDADACMIRSYTGTLVSGQHHLELRGYVISKEGDNWKAKKLSSYDLRENCTRDEEGQILPPKRWEEYC